MRGGGRDFPDPSPTPGKILTGEDKRKVVQKSRDEMAHGGRRQARLDPAQREQKDWGLEEVCNHQSQMFPKDWVGWKRG